MEKFLNKIFHADAVKLLAALPTASVHAVITDAMFGTAKNCEYEWGADPARGDPAKHWRYHEPIYNECRRVLKPGGVLAWCQGMKFVPYFDSWFGSHRIWSPLWTTHGLNYVPNVWVVQTKDRQPIEHPNHMIVRVDRKSFVPMKTLHPCPKPTEELLFMIEALTKPREIVLDCFCGIGSGLVASELLGRRWIGCDISKRYCQVAMMRLEEVAELELRA